jgi:hypothetical protein
MDETPQSQPPVAPEPVQPEAPVMQSAPIVVSASGLSAKAIALMVALGVIIIGGVAGYFLVFRNSNPILPEYNKVATKSSNKSSFNCQSLISDKQVADITGQTNITSLESGSEVAVNGLNALPGHESDQFGNQFNDNGGHQITCFYAYTDKGKQDLNLLKVGGDVAFTVVWGGNVTNGVGFDNFRSISMKTQTTEFNGHTYTITPDPEVSQTIPGIGAEAFYFNGSLWMLSSNKNYNVSFITQDDRSVQEKMAKAIDASLSSY